MIGTVSQSAPLVRRSRRERLEFGLWIGEVLGSGTSRELGDKVQLRSTCHALLFFLLCLLLFCVSRRYKRESFSGKVGNFFLALLVEFPQQDEYKFCFI